MRRCLLALLVLASQGACYKTVLRAGPPPGEHPSLEADDQIFIGMLGGLLPSRYIALDRVCPEGAWARIDNEVAPMDLVVNTLTLQVVSFQRVTVHCADDAPKGEPRGQVP